MANRYQYQFNGSLKPRMINIEGFVSVGTGGLVNAPPAYPVFPVGTGATGIAGQTGAPLGLMPGQATAGVPTGWQGGFSGVVGLLAAGVKGVQRVGTGTYALQLEDDFVRLDECQVDYYAGSTGAATAVDWQILDHTVGLGNSIATGGMTAWLGPGINPKNTIFIQFSGANLGLPVDLAKGSGFFIGLRLRDSLAGVQ